MYNKAMSLYSLDDINEQLKTLMTGLQYEGHDAFKVVTDTATQQFAGYPACGIVPANIEPDADTQQQNLRTYNFFIYCYFDIKVIGDDLAWTLSRRYIDIVMNAIDKSLDLSATADFVRPVGMQPFTKVIDEAGEVLIAPITVKCAKTIDLW
jgi:hypothetical protein